METNHDGTATEQSQTSYSFEEEDVFQKVDRIKKPWKYETGRLIAEPPDINYRQIILDDQESIKLLFENTELHFTERCLRYQTLDILVEDKLIMEYLDWNTEMMYIGKQETWTKRERAFNEGLKAALTEDEKEVVDEINQLQHETGMREAQKARQRHGQHEFFHMHDQCWYFYDKNIGQWQEEPREEGVKCETRRAQWREESLCKPEQRYFDCVKGRFYEYSLSDGLWHAQWPPFERWQAMFFKWDIAGRQWRVPDNALRFAEREAQNRPPMQVDIETTTAKSAELGLEGASESEGYFTAKEVGAILGVPA